MDEPKVKVSVNLVPFGTINYESLPAKDSAQPKKESKKPVYVEPPTTNVEETEIRYEKGSTYSVPKTTAGV